MLRSAGGGDGPHRFFEDSCDRTPRAVAVECDDRRVTYAELDARANRVAHHLRSLGMGPDSRVALLLPRSVEMYACLLGVCKAGAAFVPIDPAAPPDRVGFILRDAGAAVVLTTSALARGAAEAAGATAETGTVPRRSCRIVEIDTCAAGLARLPATRPETLASGTPDPLAYVMYTSGSSGRPKGVEIARSSICTFLRVVSRVYGIRPSDRVYQGMTISFDFSIEEIWPTWAAGATLVAGPVGPGRLGADLAEFLDRHRVTVLYCVPTLLATLPRDVPGLRSVFVGGEACPAALVERWSRPGRRLLNTYGPTEATVTATCQELRPGRPVTIGRPLPTYTAVLLDERLRPVPAGDVGEICLGGPGLARGYVGRPDLTADRFVRHALAPGDGRLYRTGDLGRLTADGEIEYLGRIDAEVKIRGYRVSLEEIDNVLLEDPGVAQAATALVPRQGGAGMPGGAAHRGNGSAGACDGGAGEPLLAAYVVRAADGRRTGDEELAARLADRLRRSLPAYMVPATLDFLDRLPVSSSGKTDRARLPRPSGRRLTAAGRTTPTTATSAVRDEREARVRDAWAAALAIPPAELPAEADFFTDLGGHSLLAAHAVSLLRERDDGVGPTLRDLYENPTVRSFTARVYAPPRAPDVRGTPEALSTSEAPDATQAPQGTQATQGTFPRRPARPRPASSPASAPPAPSRPAPRSPGPVPALRHGRARIARAGLAQGAALYALLLLLTGPLAASCAARHGRLPGWHAAGVALAVLAGYTAVRWLAPVLLARPLAAGIRPGRYPLWGRTYLRLWTLDLLLGLSPLRVVSGSPLMGPYLRLLGARVGARAAVATSVVGLPTLLRIGSDAAIGYGALLRPWQVGDGWVTVAPITIGERAYVGAHAVCAPGAELGPGAALGEQSLAGPGETIPAGARRLGSPARPVDALGPLVESMLSAADRTDRWRPRHLAAVLLGLLLLEALPVAAALPGAAFFWWARTHGGTGDALAAALLFGPVFVATVCLLVAVGKRAVLARTPAGVHPARSALGVRKWVVDKLLEHSLALTNSLYATLYTVPWLRLLGARVGRGAEVSTAAHLDPDLLTLRDGGFVADMAGVGVAAFAGDRMACAPTEVGERAFVGNAAVLPSGTRLGPGSLVGVATVPPPGPLPDGTTWLGSPALRLPVRQDSGSFPERLTFRPTRAAVLARLGIEFFRATLPMTLLATTGFGYLLALSGLAGRTGPLVTLPAAPVLCLGAMLAVVGCCALAKWVVAGRYRPRVAPLWSLFVRRTEFVTGLFEAAAVPAGVGALVGTPFLPPVLRLFGARIGRRVWLGTTYLTEFDLVEVGDDAAVGMYVSLQTHLFEDRVMKMSRVTVGPGASVGARTVVLYDAVVGGGVRLGALSLVMKGEHLPPGTAWQGLPAETDAARRRDGRGQR
ncbi:amino acid adenylation domain-containing protein [Streptomyces mexicanus]|uniref:Amino acid adenylation domain-containing protein n=2 Tax=Streptomyces mexicanus TaxID=178566 RepID=A0A7X1HZN6_9ACTN|nr:amino acid adenylation domain-containing protein [Streptomyces mexicanus]